MKDMLPHLQPQETNHTYQHHPLQTSVTTTDHPVTTYTPTGPPTNSRQTFRRGTDRHHAYPPPCRHPIPPPPRHATTTPHDHHITAQTHRHHITTTNTQHYHDLNATQQHHLCSTPPLQVGIGIRTETKNTDSNRETTKKVEQRQMTNSIRHTRSDEDKSEKTPSTARSEHVTSKPPA